MRNWKTVPMFTRGPSSAMVPLCTVRKNYVKFGNKSKIRLGAFSRLHGALFDKATYGYPMLYGKYFDSIFTALSGLDPKVRYELVRED